MGKLNLKREKTYTKNNMKKKMMMKKVAERISDV
jgi:hypothetical protein